MRDGQHTFCTLASLRANLVAANPTNATLAVHTAIATIILIGPKLMTTASTIVAHYSLSSLVNRESWILVTVNIGSDQ
jgi:hypothetical protein